MSKQKNIIIDDKGVKCNKNGVNSEIKAHILSDSKMRELGFTDYNKSTWFFCKNIPPIGKNIVWDISFSVSIPKNGDDIRIDILDENFCQPYDYQSILDDNPHFAPARHVFMKVEEYMQYLQDAGVLSGHIYGRYI